MAQIMTELRAPTDKYTTILVDQSPRVSAAVILFPQAFKLITPTILITVFFDPQTELSEDCEVQITLTIPSNKTSIIC